MKTHEPSEIESRLRTESIRDTASPVPTATALRDRVRQQQRLRWIAASTAMVCVIAAGLTCVNVGVEPQDVRPLADSSERTHSESVAIESRSIHSAEVPSQSDKIAGNFYFVIGDAMPSGLHPLLVASDGSELRLAGYVEPPRVEQTPIWNLHPSLVTQIERDWGAAGFRIEPMH